MSSNTINDDEQKEIYPWENEPDSELEENETDFIGEYRGQYTYDNDDDNDYSFDRNYCVCDKSLPFHYAIMCIMLPIQEYIHIQNYNCNYCYITNNPDMYKSDSIEYIINIYKSSPSNVLKIKNKYGDTPFKLINRLLAISEEEYNCPYAKFRTMRQLRGVIYTLTEIKEFIIKDKKEKKINKKRKYTTLLCAKQFNVQIPTEIWMKIFEYL
jgi:hypothetical protein